jgi:predicted nuclease of restriction endonuclease-like (RecB) superfamily
MFEFNIQLLADAIGHLHLQTQAKAVQQANFMLTVRNWIAGLYIVEYEQNGNDRAAYGVKAMKELSSRLRHIKGMSESQLYLFRDFYSSYPHFFQTMSGILQHNGFQENTKFLTMSGISKVQQSKIFTAKAETDEIPSLPPEKIITNLHFSHFIELLKAETSLKRVFYEVETIKNNWTVRDLKRAMSTLLFERTGLSKDKQTVIAKIKDNLPTFPSEIIRNPYVLEFLGLEEKPEYNESDLEEAILNHLQQFLIEMGRGYCFEARQKRIMLNNTPYRIDLVFYHRILKCHILLDLKIGAFGHADAGQMNMYLNYYRKNEISEGDNPPVGIILCAQKDDSLVEYATGGLSHEVFVSKYMLELPNLSVLKQLVESEIRNLNQEP